MKEYDPLENANCRLLSRDKIADPTLQLLYFSINICFLNFWGWKILWTIEVYRPDDNFKTHSKRAGHRFAISRKMPSLFMANFGSEGEPLLGRGRSSFEWLVQILVFQPAGPPDVRSDRPTGVNRYALKLAGSTPHSKI